jgi:hypothetical protein
MSKDYSKVLIATPIRGNSTVTLYTAGLLQSTGLHGGWLPMAGQSDIYVARNVLANAFVTEYKKFDTLIWIDSDIGFVRQHLQDLIDTEQPFVSGLYTDKCQPPMPFCRDNNGVQLTLDDIPKEGMIKSRFMPGGFLKVDRIVYETIIAKGLAPSYGAGKFYHFYYGKIVLDNLLSEDYSFCELAREAGFQGWINCGIRVNHDGRTLDPQQNMPATQPATTASAA